jgi:hypothetical protein
MREKNMPPPLAEVDHAAVIVSGLSRLNDDLTRPGNRTGVPFDRLSAFHWDVREAFKRDYSLFDGVKGIRNPQSPHVSVP